jgi:hypothetical protein
MQGYPLVLKNTHVEDIFPLPINPISFPFPTLYDKPTTI